MKRVVVVGGGIAGASVAYELAAEAKVTVLEQEVTCGHHSTGRSAAIFTECYGDEVVRRLAIGSRRFLQDPPDGFTDAPLATPRPLLFVGGPEDTTALDAAFVEFKALVPSIERLDATGCVKACPILRPDTVIGGVLEPNGADLDVHALHAGFLGGIRRRGGRVHTGSPVVGLERRGEAWLASTPSGVFEADVVVDAAGAWADRVGDLAGADPIGLTPMRRTAFTFPAPEGASTSGWPMVIDVHHEQFYFRPEGRSQLLASPCDQTPMEPHDVRHEEIDVALGIERIESVTTLRIRSVAHAWAGLRSFVADHRPVNGWDPSLPGFYWLAGQGGFGIKTSPAMARFAAGLILRGTVPDDLTAIGLAIGDLSVTRPGLHDDITSPSP